jgi:hypothetical protein
MIDGFVALVYNERKLKMLTKKKSHGKHAKASESLFGGIRTQSLENSLFFIHTH